MLTPMVDSQIFDLNLARLCSLNEDNSILPTIPMSPDSLGDLLNTPSSLDSSFALDNLQALAKLDNLNINNNNNSKIIFYTENVINILIIISMINNLDILQSLMSPLALNQTGLDPFSVDSASSMSSPTTTLSPGNN